MGWEADWKKWTQVTYGLIQAVDLCDRLDFGNLTGLEAAVDSARAWSPSALGFDSAATRRQVRRNSIGVGAGQTEKLLAATKRSTIEILLIETVAVTEVLLTDLLVERKVGKRRPRTLDEALRQLEEALKPRENFAKHAWAISAAHELRIVRNVLVHAAGTWSARTVNDFKRALGPARPPPTAGDRLSVGVDDLFAYRRAARTLLNAAARI